MTIFILSIFLIWRILLFAVSYFGNAFLAFNPRFPYADIFLIPSKLPQWLWTFANFDGVHYLTIAQKGYSAQFTQVYFPLYPLIIKYISLATKLNPVVLGLVIANIFFVFSIYLFYLLLKDNYEDKTIKWTLLFYVFFPTSFYFGSLYTESLFMFLVFSAFYLAKEKKWLSASFIGALATATRLVGIFLLPALLWKWYQSQAVEKQKSIFKIFFSPVLYIVPLGLAAYMIYLQIYFGDALYFWHAQPVFGAARSGSAIILPHRVLFRYFRILTEVPLNQWSFWVAALELSALFLAVFSLVKACFKKIDPSFLIFSALAVGLGVLTGTLSSMPRYILAAMPIFMVLGSLKNNFIKTGILSLMVILLIILTAVFTSGGWVA